MTESFNLVILVADNVASLSDVDGNTEVQRVFAGFPGQIALGSDGVPSRRGDTQRVDVVIQTEGTRQFSKDDVFSVTHQLGPIL